MTTLLTDFGYGWSECPRARAAVLALDSYRSDDEFTGDLFMLDAMTTGLRDRRESGPGPECVECGALHSGVGECQGCGSFTGAEW